jgi:hypothetical protein
MRKTTSREGYLYPSSPTDVRIGPPWCTIILKWKSGWLGCGTKVGVWGSNLNDSLHSGDAEDVHNKDCSICLGVAVGIPNHS